MHHAFGRDYIREQEERQKTWRDNVENERPREGSHKGCPYRTAIHSTAAATFGSIAPMPTTTCAGMVSLAASSAESGTAPLMPMIACDQRNLSRRSWVAPMDRSAATASA